MAKRGLVARVPIWVRVPGIVALVLAGVLLSSMLLNAARDGGGDGRSGGHTQMDGGSNHGTGASDHGSGGTGGHGSGDGAGHTSGTHGR
jgi:hypothetical protein